MHTLSFLIVARQLINDIFKSKLLT